MRWIMIVSLVLAVAAPHAPAAPAAPDPSIKYDRGRLQFYRGARLLATLQVEVARTTAARAQGLMYRTSMPEDAGMLFIFDDDGTGAFWMKNTLIPLSIGFISSTWTLLEIMDMNVEPDPTAPQKFYAPRQPYRYALEVNQGYFARKGIEPGVSVRFTATP
ncbi:MAG: DUF192 domain-containing protein [Armatimonadota bacterium]|nr:DUF192 domain-containing protein [Armatimonadota bacterium]